MTDTDDEFGPYVEPDEGQDQRQTQHRRPGRDQPTEPEPSEDAGERAD